MFALFKPFAAERKMKLGERGRTEREREREENRERGKESLKVRERE